jgi:copper(I)-binding protein
MKRISILFLAGMLLVSACATANTGGTGLEVRNAWARIAIQGGNSAAYMLLQNYTESDDELTGAASDIATAVEIHLSQMKTDGMMEMIKQEVIALPANGKLELKPGSYHIMLFGLKQDLKAGDKIQLTLHFKYHEEITLTIPILEN